MMDPECRIYRIRLSERSIRFKEISAIGYTFLPQAVADYTGDKAPEDLDVSREEYGKPYFTYHPEIAFNISNSGEWIYLALSSERVGIDIQEITKAPVEKVGRRVFKPEAYDAFLQMEDKREYFFREWVRRESYIKWTGEGLTRDLRKLPDDAWQSMLPAPDGYMAAITAARPLACSDAEVLYDRQKGFIWKK